MSTADRRLKILRTLMLRGPNLWSRRSVFEVWMELDPSFDRPSDEFKGLTERLMATMPSLIEHRCGVGERGGFLKRLREGTYPPHILEHLTIELECLVGAEVGFGKARETRRAGTYKVAVRYRDEAVVRRAFDLACDLLFAAVDDAPFDIDASLKELSRLAGDAGLGPSTRAIVVEAERRGIPWRRLNVGSPVLLGHACKQRRVWMEETGGTPRPVDEAIVSELFAEGEDGRIPVVCVTGTDGTTSVCRQVRHILARAGHTVGIASADGTYVGDEQVAAGDSANLGGAERVLLDPSVTSAVLEASLESILAEGLGFDRCSIAVVTRIGSADHLRPFFVETSEEIFQVARCPVDVVLASGYAVLNADDPLVAEMAPLCSGQVIFFARDASSPVLQAHREGGGKAVFPTASGIAFSEGPSDPVTVLEFPAADAPPSRIPPSPHALPSVEATRLEVALAAVGAALAMSISRDLIQRGLASCTDYLGLSPEP